MAIATCKFLDSLCRQETCHQRGGGTLTEARGFGGILDENDFARRLDFDFFEKDSRRDDGFQVALLRTRSQRFIRNGVVELYRHLPHHHRGYIHASPGSYS